MTHIDSYDPEAPRPLVDSEWVWGNECIVVTGVYWNGEEWWVETQYKRYAHLSSSDLYAPRRHWNDLGVFWERARHVATKPGPPKAGPRQRVMRSGSPYPDELPTES